VISRVVQSSVPFNRDQKEGLAPGLRPLRKMAMSWLATTTILLVVGFVSLLIGATHWFGSVGSASAYLRGDGLIPDSYTMSFGTATAAERPSVAFALRNYTKQPIKVLGTNSSCTCLVTSGLPVVVPPNGRAVLTVSARAKSRLGSYTERVRVLTDAGESNLILYVRGIFR